MGSTFGVQVAISRPDLFYAYIGNGQMVNTTEDDVRRAWEVLVREAARIG